MAVHFFAMFGGKETARDHVASDLSDVAASRAETMAALADLLQETCPDGPRRDLALCVRGEGEEGHAFAVTLSLRGR